MKGETGVCSLRTSTREKNRSENTIPHSRWWQYA